MFRHDDYIQKEDYPFNAGYVVFKNYFFPLVGGVVSEIPMKEFPKAFAENFIYFVDNVLDESEREIINKTFKEKKDANTVASELGITVKELVKIRTRAFQKLKSPGRERGILSDSPYRPKTENKRKFRLGDYTAEIITKTPEAHAGGGEYKLINVESGKFKLFSIRMSTNTNIMTDDEMKSFVVEILKSASKVKSTK